MSLNQQIFIFISQFSEKNHFLDFVAVSLAEYMPYFFIIILVICWLCKKGGYQNFVLYAGYSAFLGLAINYSIAIFYFHNRPFMDGLGNNLVQHIAETSFPSDHATFMFSIAISFLLFQRTKVLGIVLITLGFMGGLARVFVGAHYPLDIVGSIVVACVSAFIIYIARNKFEKINIRIINLYRSLVSRRK